MTYFKIRQNGDILKDALLPRHFVNIFDNLLDESLGVKPGVHVPQADILEREKDYLLQILLPGLSKDNITITEEDNKLVLKGERKKPELNDGEKVHLNESFYGKFQRSFNLPENVDKEKIRAEFKDGILYITLEKTEPVHPRTIVVE